MSDTRTEIILAHADRRIPRYTSYPTAPHFSPAVTGATYRGWLEAVPEGTPVSLYLHVPFCRQMCWYCGCHTRATVRNEPVESYLDKLELELDLLALVLPRRLPLVHVHWGGGSPTLVRAARFRGIMERLKRSFELAADAEIAVEVDPRVLQPDFVAAMAASGVNRASLGVQTFEKTVQAAVNRVQPYELVADAIARLRDAGIGRLNADLMYGLPRQTKENVTRTAERLIGLEPDRVAVFGYAHVPHMKRHQQLIDAAALPGPAERLAQADAMAAVLTGAGFQAIGLDHFATFCDSLAVAQRAGRLHRNFQGYTTDPAPLLLGVGASAIGSLPQGYVQNTADNAAWQREVLERRLPVTRGLRLDDEDRLRREIIERLMCDLAVDPAAIAARYGRAAPAADLERLAADGVVRLNGSRIVVEEAFRPLVRVVAAAFDARLELGGTRHAVAV